MTKTLIVYHIHVHNDEKLNAKDGTLETPRSDHNFIRLLNRVRIYKNLKLILLCLGLEEDWNRKL